MARIPTHRCKTDGRGVVTLDGRDFYTGRYGTPEAKEKYDRLVAEWLACGRRVPPRRQRITVAELIAQYKKAGEDRDGRDGRVLPRITGLYSHTYADEFGPLAFKAVREQFVQAGWTRQDINLCAHRIKRLFRWAVAEELIGADVADAIAAVEGLRFGRTKAKEGKKVVPVAETVFRATLPYLSRQLAAVAELQWWTAMRSGETLALMPAAIDRSGPGGCWVYRPSHHKNRHRGHDRTVLIGPQGQAVLTPWLERAPALLCFRPCEVHHNGGEEYTPAVYARAVGLAAIAAKVEHWHPHQLRHAAAQRLRAAFGIEAAQAVLGHRHLQMTEVYAAAPLGRAAEAMGRAG
jgi:integrase